MTSPRRKQSKRQRKAAGTRAVARTGPELYTLGRVRLVQEGAEQTAKLGPKHLALLIYLFHELRPMHPSEVTELIGRGQEEDREVAALKKAVAWLNENVAGVSIRVTAETVEVVSGLWLDAREVDAAIDSGDPVPVEELYAGEFLEGFESGAPAFDEWAKKERGRLKRAWTHAMIAAAHKAERRSDWERAADWWHILVGRAPMRPEAVASLLHAYVMSGQEQNAGLAFAEYASRLEQSGIAEPADPVKRVLAEHTVLQDITGVHEELAPAEEIGAEESPAGPSSVESGEQTEIQEEAGDEEWQDFVDLAMPGELDLALGREPLSPEPGEDVGEQAFEPLEPLPENLDGEADVAAAGAGGTHREPDIDEPFTDAPPTELAETRGEPGECEEPAGREAARSFELRKRPTHPVGAGEQVRPRRSEWRAGPAGWVEALMDGAAEAARALRSVVGAAAQTGEESVWALRPLLRRFAYAVVAVGIAGLAFAFGPRLLGVVGLSEDVPEVGTPALPKVNLPKVTVPKVTVKTPSFVETSVSKIGEMLSGPILSESGEWILVADFEVDAPTEPGTAVLGETLPETAVSGQAEEGTPDASEQTPPLPADTGAAPADTSRSAAAAAAPNPLDAGPGPEAGDSAAIAEAEEKVSGDEAAAALTEDSLAAMSAPGVDESARAPEARSLEPPAEPLAAGDSLAPGSQEAQTPGQDTIVTGQAPADSLGQPVTAVEPAAVDSAAGEVASLAALELALEADLSQAAYFNVVPRERALVALGRRTGQLAERLSASDATALAETEGYTAVVSGRLSRGEGVDSLKLLVLNSAGDTLYGVAAEFSSEITRLETLIGLARAVRRRLGEPEGEIESSPHPARFLTRSSAALNAYAEARRHLYAGRYPEAVAAAGRATERDTAFAMAYLVLADAYAQRGVRMRGRSALETAFRLRNRLPERERIRVQADRFAWDGRFSDAAVGYDELFQRYRDDVGALKSQALMQRMVGARGGGEGNLRVAYSIDRYDWPRLSRIARYVGYTGPLPDVDSLIAALEPAPAPAAQEE